MARSVKPKELKLNKKALAAMEKEWGALREVGAWEEKRVREWADVREEAKKKGIRMHVGTVFGICVEKVRSCLKAARNENTKGVSFSEAVMSGTKATSSQRSRTSAPPQRACRQANSSTS